MDQNKNAQTQPTQGHQGQQRVDKQEDMGQRSTATRDQAEGSRDRTGGGNMGSQERGTGSQNERNRSDESGDSRDSGGSSGSSGISNRGMSPSEEQMDLPSRGSTGESSRDQSER